MEYLMISLGLVMNGFANKTIVDGQYIWWALFTVLTALCLVCALEIYKKKA